MLWGNCNQRSFQVCWWTPTGSNPQQGAVLTGWLRKVASPAASLQVSSYICISHQHTSTACRLSQGQCMAVVPAVGPHSCSALL